MSIPHWPLDIVDQLRDGVLRIDLTSTQSIISPFSVKDLRYFKDSYWSLYIRLIRNIYSNESAVFVRCSVAFTENLFNGLILKQLLIL